MKRGVIVSDAWPPGIGGWAMSEWPDRGLPALLAIAAASLLAVLAG